MIGAICESHTPNHPSRFDLPASSYHLLYGASLLQVFSLFMLSLARPDNYYQVRIPRIQTRITHEMITTSRSSSPRG